MVWDDDNGYSNVFEAEGLPVYVMGYEVGGVRSYTLYDYESGVAICAASSLSELKKICGIS